MLKRLIASISLLKPLPAKVSPQMQMSLYKRKRQRFVEI